MEPKKVFLLAIKLGGFAEVSAAPSNGVGLCIPNNNIYLQLPHFKGVRISIII